MNERSASGFVRTLLKIEREGISGTLSVRAEGVTTCIHFRNGALVFADGGTPGEALGRVLVDDGVIREEEFVEAIRVMTDSLVDNEQMRLGEVLVMLGTLTLEQVQEALARQVRRKVMRCLQWDKMNLALEPVRSDERPGHFPTPLQPLLLEGVRRFVERERMMALLKPWVGRHAKLRGRAAEIGGKLAMTPREIEVIQRLDGRTRLYELLRELATQRPDPIPLVCALLLADQLEAQAEPLAAASEPAPAGRRPTKAQPRRQRPTWRSEIPEDEPRAERPTWRNVRELPRRQRGTHRPLGEATLDGTAATTQRVTDAEGAAAPSAAEAPTLAESKRLRLEAEQAYQRGLRLLGSERYAVAEAELSRASRAMPEVAEYALGAAWARYRQCQDAGELAALREELYEWVRRAAQQDKSLAFPPYVAAHLELAEGNEERALRYFRVAAERNTANIDAQRHVRLLAKRLGKPR